MTWSALKFAFTNRQRGAGTRVLLDYHLGRMDIAAESIRGYSQEEYTHLGVAAAVASGRADCGLAIAAAAQALDLEFVPLFKERYDLVCTPGGCRERSARSRVEPACSTRVSRGGLTAAGL